MEDMSMLTQVLTYELERLGYKTVQQKADACGLNYEYMRQVLKGKALSEERIFEIGSKLKLSKGSIMGLLVAKIKDKAKKEETKKMLDEVLNSKGHLQIDHIVPGNTLIDPPSEEFYKAPVYASIQAGCGDLCECNAEIVDEVLLTKEEHRSKCFCIQIAGDSMETLIRNGDIGVFEPPNGMQPAEGDIVAVELEGYAQWMVKALKILAGGKLELVSENPKHKPIKVNPRVEKISIKGILLRTVRKFKKKLFLNT